jgi:hypothetical protein
MPFNFIVLATPPFTAFGFIHDKNNEYYKLEEKNMRYTLLLLLSICFLAGCAEKFSRQPSGHLFAQFYGDVGKRISTQGTLRHDFDGKSYLETSRGHIWLDSVQVVDEQNGKTIKATGVVQKHKDLPIVTIPKNHDLSSPVPKGITVPEGTNVDKARVRFSLSNVSYRTIEKRTSNKPDTGDGK